MKLKKYKVSSSCLNKNGDISEDVSTVYATSKLNAKDLVVGYHTKLNLVTAVMILSVDEIIEIPEEVTHV